ncbi:MAG: hypothetical protein JXR27_13110 [Paludibacteraceae bacterium]|nr:hypothetical protein [Paludibacteraceae bacterium]
MKKLFALIFTMIVPLLIVSCDTSPIDTENGIICKAVFKNDISLPDSLFFDESHLISYDTTSHEIKIKKMPGLDEFRRFSHFVFYLGNDSLFSAETVFDYMSSTRSNLVLRYSAGKIYLESSYPPQLNDSLSIANEQKRAAAMKIFVERLKKTGKLAQ